MTEIVQRLRCRRPGKTADIKKKEFGIFQAKVNDINVIAFERFKWPGKRTVWTKTGPTVSCFLTSGSSNDKVEKAT